MSKFLEVLSSEVGPDDHVVLVLDRAGWHMSKGLVVPANVMLLPCRRNPPNSTRSSVCGCTSRATS